MRVLQEKLITNNNTSTSCIFALSIRLIRLFHLIHLKFLVPIQVMFSVLHKQLVNTFKREMKGKHLAQIYEREKLLSGKAENSPTGAIN